MNTRNRGLSPFLKSSLAPFARFCSPISRPPISLSNELFLKGA